MTTLYHPRPVVVVTGANSGIGFSICHRLIVQLSRSQPPDASVQPNLAGYFSDEHIQDDQHRKAPYDGLTIIMACRSLERAEVAREELYRHLDLDIAQQKKARSYDGHADIFKSNLRINIHILDLGNIRSVLQFGQEIDENYPYVSHAIFNAGATSFYGIDWVLAIKEILRRPIYAATEPVFKKQLKGELSADGLGRIWQCNVFGHYVLYRRLEKTLRRYAETTSELARVIWMSSIQASPSYERDDWQLVRTDYPYEGTKYQTDLLAGYFEEQQRTMSGSAHTSDEEVGKVKRREFVCHILMQPGVVATSIFHGALFSWLVPLMVGFFYLARWLGSPNHPISAFKAAFAPVHLCLVPLYTTYPLSKAKCAGCEDPAGLPNRRQPKSTTCDKSMDYSVSDCIDHRREWIRSPPKFGSETSRFGHDRVGIAEIEDWETHREDGVQLVEKCEKLYQTFLRAESIDLDSS